MAELRRSKRKKTAEEPEKMMSEPEKMRKKIAEPEKMRKKIVEPEKMMAEPEKIPFERGVSNLVVKMNGISQGAKEVFLWELVRNSARALYDFRCRTMYETDLIGDEGLFIVIIPDKDKKTLSIVDNGIGMTLDDLKNIFFNILEPALEKYNVTVDKVVKKKIKVDEFYSRNLDARLGFLSAYMVADKVEITTKHYAGNSQCRMFSSASERWCSLVEEDLVAPVSSVGRGTRVTLQLNKDYFEYLEECRLKVLIDKSTFDVCPYPVSIHARNITLGRSADLEDSKEDMKLLKRKFERLRRLFRKELKNEVEEVVVSDRIFDLPSFLSLDKKTLEINPRNSVMENLRQDAEFNPNDKELLDAIYAQYVVGKALISIHIGKAYLQHLQQL